MKKTLKLVRLEDYGAEHGIILYNDNKMHSACFFLGVASNGEIRVVFEYGNSRELGWPDPHFVGNWQDIIIEWVD